MEEIMKYVKPELLMVAVVLYFIGIGLKQSHAFSNDCWYNNLASS